MQTKFLRTRDVIDIIGVSKPTLYKWIGERTFPEPVAITAMRIGFVESEVRDWMQARMDDRQQGAEVRRERAMRAVECRKDRRP